MQTTTTEVNNLAKQIISLSISASKMMLCHSGTYYLPFTGHGTNFYNSQTDYRYQLAGLYHFHHTFENPINNKLWYRLKIHSYDENLRIKITDLDEREVPLDNDILIIVLKQLITQLNIFQSEHQGLDKINDADKQGLEELCKLDGKILLHATTADNIPGILEKGLHVWNLGLSCRTTAMIDSNLKTILNYIYGTDWMHPRNVIIYIPSNLFTIEESNENKHCGMVKCQDCDIIGFKEGYGNWCYHKNLIYEAILEPQDSEWYIPKRFIYGVMDYNGNLQLNPNFNPTGEVTKKQEELLKRKLFSNELKWHK